MNVFRTRMHNPASVAVCKGGGGVSASAHAGIPPGPGDPPRCVPGDPPGQTPQPPPWVWAWRPPWPDPPTSPLCLETPLARPLNLPPGCGPGDPPARHPNLPSGCAPGDPRARHPPVNRILDRRFWKYYLAPTSLRVVIIWIASYHFERDYTR